MEPNSDKNKKTKLIVSLPQVSSASLRKRKAGETSNIHQAKKSVDQPAAHPYTVAPTSPIGSPSASASSIASIPKVESTDNAAAPLSDLARLSRAKSADGATASRSPVLPTVLDLSSKFTKDEVGKIAEIQLSSVPLKKRKLDLWPETEDPSLVHYKCTFCRKYCFSLAELEQHERLHTENKKLMCPTCKTGFSRRSYLRDHMHIHEGAQPHVCTYCSKAFSLRCNLVRHVRIHTGEKPYVCNICKQAFTLKKNMIEHQRTHTGERPFPCPSCTLQFSRRSSLIRHARTHTQEKEYICHHCGKTFSCKYYLRRHTTTHMEKKPRKRRTRAEILSAKAAQMPSQVVFVSVPETHQSEEEDDPLCSINDTCMPVEISNIKIEESEELGTPCRVMLPGLPDNCNGVVVKEEVYDSEIDCPEEKVKKKLIVALPRAII